MRTIIALLFVCWFAVITNGRQKESSATLDETLSWIEGFTKAHGTMSYQGKILETTSVSGVEGCTVSVDHNYTAALNGTKIRKRTETISLSDFDPESVKTKTDHWTDAEDTFEVQFETSDAKPKVVATLKSDDGTKRVVNLSQEFVSMDSFNSANRLVKAMKQAIKLCGGKPAPF